LEVSEIASQFPTYNQQVDPGEALAPKELKEK